MRGIIRVDRCFDCKIETIFESDAMPWEEVTETLKVLLKPSMFGSGEIFSIKVLVVK